ncbi:hypothetical protein [Arthrobacter sp. Y81]|uniref:hypothetical protein n=1 Tax=Arthrobacter sp. Y81 TaxID=2058897 RepID=UPI0011B0143A|nr:hypothetical protein [Arthrobacter sp. Y81]
MGLGKGSTCWEKRLLARKASAAPKIPRKTVLRLSVPMSPSLHKGSPVISEEGDRHACTSNWWAGFGAEFRPSCRVAPTHGALRPSLHPDVSGDVRGRVLLSLVFFGAAALLGYSNLGQLAPELTVLVIAISLSLQMLAWMRFMGMGWRPTLEMSGATMVAGLLLITAYRLDLVAGSELIPLQTGLLACPSCSWSCLFRFRLYSVGRMHHRPDATE